MLALSYGRSSITKEAAELARASSGAIPFRLIVLLRFASLLAYVFADTYPSLTYSFAVFVSTKISSTCFTACCWCSSALVAFSARRSFWPMRYSIAARIGIDLRSSSTELFSLSAGSRKD